MDSRRVEQCGGTPVAEREILELRGTGDFASGL